MLCICVVRQGFNNTFVYDVTLITGVYLDALVALLE